MTNVIYGKYSENAEATAAVVSSVDCSGGGDGGDGGEQMEDPTEGLIDLPLELEVLLGQHAFGTAQQPEPQVIEGTPGFELLADVQMEDVASHLVPGNLPANSPTFPPLATSRPRRRSVLPGAHGPDTIRRPRSRAL